MAGKVSKEFGRRSHWHCSLCLQLFKRNSEFLTRLKSHDIKAKPPAKKASKDIKFPPKKSALTPRKDIPVKEICPECQKGYPNKHTLQRHTREVHRTKREGVITAAKYLNGVCVDLR